MKKETKPRAVMIPGPDLCAVGWFCRNIAAVSCMQAIIEASGGINEILLCRRTQNVLEEVKSNGNGWNGSYIGMQQLC